MEKSNLETLQKNYAEEIKKIDKKYFGALRRLGRYYLPRVDNDPGVSLREKFWDKQTRLLRSYDAEHETIDKNFAEKLKLLREEENRNELARDKYLSEYWDNLNAEIAVSKLGGITD